MNDPVPCEELEEGAPSAVGPGEKEDDDGRREEGKEDQGRSVPQPPRGADVGEAPCRRVAQFDFHVPSSSWFLINV